MVSAAGAERETGGVGDATAYKRMGDGPRVVRA